MKSDSLESAGSLVKMIATGRHKKIARQVLHEYNLTAEEMQEKLLDVYNRNTEDCRCVERLQQEY